MRGIELSTEVPVAEVVERGRRAAEAGFEAVFTSCHYNNRDPFVAAARLAAATEEVLVGPAAANPYETHPVKLASQAATLQEDSGGRAVFGVGAGDRSTLRNLGLERERPLRRVLETVQVARTLWAGERVDHDGAFRAVDAGLNYAVDPLPAYVGAQGPDMLRMAGKHADGVLVNAAHPRDLSWAADRVAEGRAERPADRDPPTVAAYAVVSVAEDRAAARGAARIPVAFVAAGAPRAVLDRHDVDPDAAANVGDAVKSGAFADAADRVTERMLEAFAIAGTPADVAARVEAAREHVDGVVAGSPLGPDPARAIDLLGRALAP